MKNVLTYLKKLAKNNNREWFNEHKNEYQNAHAIFLDYVHKVIEGISRYDGEIFGLDPKTTVFRIYRDVRFSKNKTPYKNHFSASISPSGKSVSEPVYYVHIEPGNNVLAGGVYMPDSSQLLSIRNAIVGNPKGFQKILNHKKFLECFGGIEGEKLKTFPKGFDRNHPMIEFLRYKSYTVFRRGVNDSEVENSAFDRFSISTFQTMYPFILFLRDTMKSGSTSEKGY